MAASGQVGAIVSNAAQTGQAAAHTAKLVDLAKIVTKR
jgi:hypothetical protein